MMGSMSHVTGSSLAGTSIAEKLSAPAHCSAVLAAAPPCWAPPLTGSLQSRAKCPALPQLKQFLSFCLLLLGGWFFLPPFLGHLSTLCPSAPHPWHTRSADDLPSASGALSLARRWYDTRIMSRRHWYVTCPPWPAAVIRST